MNERLFVDPKMVGGAASTLAGTPRIKLLTVPHALHGSVTRILSYREEFGSGQTVHERVLPDGTIRLVFNLGNPAALASPRRPGDMVQVIGAWARPTAVLLSGRMNGLSVSLRPSATRRLLGVSASEISGQVLHLDDLWGGSALALWRSLGAVNDRATQLHLIERALSRDSRSDTPHARLTDHAVHLVEKSGGQRSVADVAKALGVGERRLQQLFQEHVGIAPRTYRRISRLRACLGALHGKAAVNWAWLSQEVGYYDQAHLTKDFRDLTGLTPQAYLERSIAGFSKTGEHGGGRSTA